MLGVLFAMSIAAPALAGELLEDEPGEMCPGSQDEGAEHFNHDPRVSGRKRFPSMNGFPIRKVARLGK